jgi:hypothetical protein
MLEWRGVAGRVLPGRQTARRVRPHPMNGRTPVVLPLFRATRFTCMGALCRLMLSAPTGPGATFAIPRLGANSPVL